MDGRLYWALTPGVGERENAIQTITASLEGSSTGKKYKRTVPDDEERKGMRKWSWFIGVWGKRPVPEGVAEKSKAAGRKNVDSDDDSESDSVDEHCWWGFWDPVEIKKVADWIEIRGGLGGGDESPEEAAQPVKDGQDGDASSRSSSPLSDSEVDDDELYAENSSKIELKALVKGLKEYASLLEWRVQKDIDNAAVKPSGSGVVATSKF
jgi:hypothetical protein